MNPQIELAGGNCREARACGDQTANLNSRRLGARLATRLLSRLVPSFHGPSAVDDSVRMRHVWVRCPPKAGVNLIRAVPRRHAAAPMGRARLMRSRSRGECIASQMSLRRCTLSQKSGLLPKTRAKDERSRSCHSPAVVAQLVHVLALHTHGICQRALRKAHRLP
jgi:hypothetical protein